ncbi:MAG: hypothetical protein PHS80_09550 [Methanothrix sp.]|nr:hypothetical protein [Methanothrix sp.]MDD4447081.1 hypothetical protein [Methanothrix sp.]
MVWKEISAICLVSVVIMLALPTVGATKDTISELKSTISSFDDPRMNAEDLAFYLVTHEFDAKPKDGYVEVGLEGRICKLTPNGSAPGLCSIAA